MASSATRLLLAGALFVAVVLVAKHTVADDERCGPLKPWEANRAFCQDETGALIAPRFSRN